MNYEELEGREIELINQHGVKYTGIVVGCDYDIGLTIMNKDDKDHYLVCLQGPSSHQWMESWDDRQLKFYRECFEETTLMIKDGFIDYKVVIELVSKHGLDGGLRRGASQDTCSFS
jgi:hypothetical protein